MLNRASVSRGERLHRTEVLLWVEQRVLEHLVPDASPSVVRDVEERIATLETAVLRLRDAGAHPRPGFGRSSSERRTARRTAGTEDDER